MKISHSVITEGRFAVENVQRSRMIHNLINLDYAKVRSITKFGQEAEESEEHQRLHRKND